MGVLRTQRAPTVRTFMKGPESVQAVNPLHDRFILFLGDGLWHLSIVDVVRDARSDADQLRFESQ
jgi:hypothetical protein